MAGPLREGDEILVEVIDVRRIGNRHQRGGLDKPSIFCFMTESRLTVNIYHPWALNEAGKSAWILSNIDHNSDVSGDMVIGMAVFD